MNTAFVILQAMLSVVLVVALGAVLRRVDLLSTQADRSLLALTINVLFPCLIFDNVLGSSALEAPRTALLAPATGFGVATLSILLALGIARMLRLGSEPVLRTFALSAGLQNYAYMAIPLAFALFGTETAAVLLVHNLGIEVALWTVGVIVLARLPLRASAKRLLSPQVGAIVLAVSLNFALGREQIPRVILQPISWLSAAAIPLGLLLTGATMLDHARGLLGPGNLRTSLAGCAVRLGLLPLGYLALTALPAASPELRQVFVLQAAMPAAVFPIVLAKHHGGDSLTALRVVFATSFVALLSMPLWLHFGVRLLQ